MVKNKIGGKKHKRSKNNTTSIKVKLEEKSKDQEYAVIDRALGSGRFSVRCNDGITRMGTIRGKDRKRNFYNKDDVILIQLWSDMSKTDKCSIIHKYNDDNINELISKNYIQESLINNNTTNNFDNEYCSFEFDYNDEINDGPINEKGISYEDIYNISDSDDNEDDDTINTNSDLINTSDNENDDINIDEI